MKPPNEILARHMLATRKQLLSEIIDRFFQSLKLLTKECGFKDVTGDVYTLEAVRDAFILGCPLSLIRYLLLEKRTLTFEEAVQEACNLKVEQFNADINVLPL